MLKRKWKKRNWIQQVQKTQEVMLQRVNGKWGGAWRAKCRQDYFLKTDEIVTCFQAEGHDLVQWRKIIMQEREKRTAGTMSRISEKQ